MEEVKKYAFSTVLDASYEEAVVRVKDALKDEGLGVLTDIDVKATLKQKLGIDFRKYVILGACNPPCAHRSLEADLDVGLSCPATSSSMKLTTQRPALRRLTQYPPLR
jgi:uncharacterized protein (DUF302 family)